MSTYKVPVSTDVQLFRYVTVEADSPKDATDKVQGMIDVVTEHWGDDSELPTDLALLALSHAAIQEAVSGLQSGNDNEWEVGIITDATPVRVDRFNEVVVVTDEPVG